MEAKNKGEMSNFMCLALSLFHAHVLYVFFSLVLVLDLINALINELRIISTHLFFSPKSPTTISDL